MKLFMKVINIIKNYYIKYYNFIFIFLKFLNIYFIKGNLEKINFMVKVRYNQKIILFMKVSFLKAFKMEKE